MSKIQFAKIFELPIYQVLVIKEYDSENKVHDVTQKTEIESCAISVKSSFKIKEHADEYFDAYDNESAQLFIKGIMEINSN